MFRKLRRKIVRIGIVSGVGAAATYFLDRDRGVERREQAKAKASALLHRRDDTSAEWAPPAGAGPAPDVPGSASVDIVVETITVDDAPSS